MNAQHIAPRSWAIAALIAVFGLVAATACSSKDATGDASQPPGKPAASTPWQQTLAKVGADGTVDVSTALAAFALAVGPVPGVTPPPGDRSDITSGTIAIRWVGRVWKQLSTSQKQAVQDALSEATPGHSIRAGAPPKPVPLPLDPNGPNVPCQAADSEGASAYRTLVDDAVSKITARLGRGLPTPPVVLVDTKILKDKKTGEDDPADMYTYACKGKAQTNNSGKGCTVHITTKDNLVPANSPDTASALAHEVMHCFVTNKIGAVAEDRLPDWYGEGLPSWVASSIGAVGSIIDNHWRSYLNSATRPLSQRTYDGIGFFVHLAETGKDPWSVIDSMADAMAGGAGTAAGWSAAGVSTAFLDSWGSGYVQGAGGMTGRAWTTSGPGLSTYRPNIPTAPGGEVVNGKSLTIDSPAQATWPVTASVSAEVVLVKPSGASGRISLGNGTDATFAAAAGATYCTLGAANCKCPEGSPGEGTKFTPMEKGLQYVTPTGGLTKASVTVAGQSLEEFCKSQASRLVGTWKATSGSTVATAGSGSIKTIGGAGATMTIAKNGAMSVRYNGMAPASYDASGAGAGGLHGTATATGTDTATLDLKRAGVWQPRNLHVGTTVTVKMTVGPSSSYHGPEGVGQFFGPIYAGTWKINGNTLSVVWQGDNGGFHQQTTWTFTRVK